MAKGICQVGAVGVVVARVNQRIKKPVIDDFCESGVLCSIDWHHLLARGDDEEQRG